MLRTKRWRYALEMVAAAAMGAAACSAQTPTQPPARPPSNQPAEAATDAAEAHLGRGYDALRDERYEVAANEFRAALQLDPKLTLRARFPLAVALFEMKKTAEARLQLEAVRRETGDHPNVSYYLGRLDLDERNYESAIRHLSAAAEKPPYPDTAYYLGFACLKQGDLAAAEKWLKEAARLNPHDGRVQYQLGLVYRGQGREREAKEAMARSGEQRQQDAELSRLRVECAHKLEQGPREEAHAVCDQLYDPDDADKLTELGTIYGQHGDAEAALNPLERAAELKPQSAQAQYNVALAYVQLGQFEKARGPLSDAAEHWPDVFRIIALYGAVLAKLGDDSGAYSQLQHAHRLNATDAQTGDLLFLTSLSLGRKAAAAGATQEAIRYFQEAAQLKPQEPSPHRELADLYKKLGGAARAAAEQEEAERLTKALQTRQ